MYISTALERTKRALFLVFPLIAFMAAQPVRLAQAQYQYQEYTDLELTKTVDKAYPAVDDKVTFTISVHNNGYTPDAGAKATDIIVKDHLVSGLTYVSGSATTGGPHGITFSETWHTWTIEWLEPGDTVELKFKAKITRKQQVENCAEIWAASPQDIDSTPGSIAYGSMAGGKDAEDDQDCVSVGVVSGGSISGMVFEDKNRDGQFNYGEPGAYGFDVDLNAMGPDYRCGTYDDYEIARTQSDHDGNFVFWDVSPGSYCVHIDDINVPYGYTRTTARELKVDVPYSGHAEGVKFGFAKPIVDLELTKKVDNAYPTVGERVVFSIKVKNNDETHYDQPSVIEKATDIQIVDYLPDGFEFYRADGGSYTHFDAYSMTWTIGHLEPGQHENLILEAIAKKSGEYRNCAEVWDLFEHDRDSWSGVEAGGKLVGGPDAEDDQDCVSLWVAPEEIDLELTKTVDNAYPEIGDKVLFSIKVRNNNMEAYQEVKTADATNVYIKDYLPDGLKLHRTVEPAGTHFDHYDSTWRIYDLPAGEEITLLLEAEVEKAGEFVNCAEVWDSDQADRDSQSGAVAGDQIAGGPHAEDDQDCTTLWVEPETIDLELTKMVYPEYPKVGEDVTFTLTLTNNDKDEYGKPVKTIKATNIFVKDYLPNGVTLVDYSAVTGGPNGITFDAYTSTFGVEWLDPGESVKLIFKATPQVYGEFENCAEVWDVDQDDRDSTPGNLSGYEARPYEDDYDCAQFWTGDAPPPPPVGKGNVSGVVFHDRDYDGELDHYEEGLPGFEVDLVEMGPDYKCGTYDDREIASIDTDHEGRFNFWEVEAGRYCVRILDITIPHDYIRTSPDPVAIDVPAYGTVENVNFGFKKGGTPPPPPPHGDTLCYLVADNDGNSYDSGDVLTKLSAGAYQDVVVGATGTQMIEAIAFDPWAGKLYASDANSLGTIDLYTGKYHLIGSFGGGEGAEGWLAFLDVDGLTFDPYTKDLFGSVRRVGRPDLLIRIDPYTGSAVEDAFGYGVDYLVIESQYGLQDIDDLAVDPYDRTLYAINNEDGRDSRLVTIDPSNGWVSKVLELPVENVEGLGFFNNGTLYGTAGEGDEALVIIDKHSLRVEVHALLGADGNRDYEAVDCLTAEPNELRVTVFDDYNGDGQMQGMEVVDAGIPVVLYRDIDEDGVITGADRLLVHTSSTETGIAAFSAAATGSFLLQVDTGSPIIGSPGLQADLNGFGMEVADAALSMDGLQATSNESETNVPTGFALEGNYPNPFNPETTIRFSAPEAGALRLSVHDLLGREIAVLIDGVVAAGEHKVSFDAADRPSGTYLARLVTPAGVQTRSMVLLK